MKNFKSEAEELFHAFMCHFNSKFSFETFVLEITSVLNELEDKNALNFAERKEFVKYLIECFERGSGKWDENLKKEVAKAMIVDKLSDDPRKPTIHTTSIIMLMGSDKLRYWVLSH